MYDMISPREQPCPKRVACGDEQLAADSVSGKLWSRLPRWTQRRLIVIFFAFCLLLVAILCLLDGHRYDISSTIVHGLPYNWRLRGEQHPSASQSYIERSLDLRPGSDFMQQQALVQRKRKRTLQAACRRHPELAKMQLTQSNRKLLYATEKSRLLYCVVPKAGCTNWKKVLMVLEGHQQHVWNITGYEAHKKNHLRNMSSMLPEERKHVLETYPKFIYVRDPFVRLISAYRNKIARDMAHQGQVFQDYARRIVLKYRPGARLANLEAEGDYHVTWDEWIRYLTDPAEISGFNHHWMEFYKLCFPCRIQYDFIGNLETISADSAYMLSVLGLDQVSYPSSAASHSTEFYEQYFANISRDDLLRLWKIYRLDFELFGFAMPSALKAIDVSE